VVLVVGFYDIEHVSSRQFGVEYRTLVNVIKARLGNCSVYAVSIPPVPGLCRRGRVLAKLLNENIVGIATELNIQYYPLHRAFLFAGSPKVECFEGAYGLSNVGESIVVKALKLIRAKCLK
jgi:hypothetical protein